MTKQKTLKSRIRARMERTGETYTTARRHVVGAVRGTHRPSAQLDYLLRQEGVTAPHTGAPYSEAMLCGLGGGIGFLYAVFAYRTTTTMTVVAQHHPEPFIPAALARLGVEAQVSTTRSAAVASRRLSGPALCATVDLPWRPTEYGDPVDVILVGRDGDDALVEDDGPRRLPWSTFVAAGGGRAQHRILTLGATGPVDLPAAIVDAVATTAAHLTGPVLGHAYDVNFGLSGMARLVADLGDPTSRTGWARRFPTPEALTAAVHRLHDCLERELTAPSATRPLYATFLDEAATVVDAPAYTEAAELYRAAGAHWSALASAAAQLTGPSDLGTLHTHAARAVEVERTAVGLLA